MIVTGEIGADLTLLLVDGRTLADKLLEPHHDVLLLDLQPNLLLFELVQSGFHEFSCDGKAHPLGELLAVPDGQFLIRIDVSGREEIN